MDYATTARAGSVGALQYAGEPTPQSSFVSPLETAATYSGEAANRAENLANRLCGSVESVEATNAKLASVPNCVFENVSALGSNVNRNLDRITTALSRIEAALP